MTGKSRTRGGRFALRLSGAVSLAAGVAIAATAAFPGVISSGAASIPDVGNAGLFELEGNIVQDTATPPPWDWACVFDVTANCEPSSAVMLGRVFQADYTKPDTTYFASNKDIQDINAWGCVTLNNPLDKDEILNAYGVALQRPSDGHVVVYLAQERSSNNGDSFAGFWLMKSQHTCTNGAFGGVHDNGDILIVSNYVGGGDTEEVDVYRWVSGALVELPTQGGLCGGANTTNSCAIANSTTLTAPWAPHQSIAPNEFVEEGIDLTNLLPPLPGDTSSQCFSNFLSETRSSQQLTATLKDYTSGRFSFCVGPHVTTQQTAGGHTSAAMTVEAGTGVSDQATLSGTVGTPKGTITYNLYSGTSCTGTPVYSSGPFNVTASGLQTASGTTSPTTVGVYEWQVAYSGDVNLGGRNFSATSACGDEPLTVVNASVSIGLSAVNPVNQAHTFTITASGLAPAGVPVTFTSITTSVSPTPSSSSTTCGSPAINGTVATCTLTINSTSVQDYVANATAVVVAGGVSMTRSTSGNSGPGGSGPATKDYVDAHITINPPSAVNEVGQDHVFTVVMTAVPGSVTPVVFGAITASVSPTTNLTKNASTCGSPVISGNTATCTLTINSSAAGTYTANATGTVTIGGVPLTRSTDGVSPNSGSAVKTYVDAAITIGPSAFNPVGREHVFTITVTASPAGASPVSFDSITPSVTPAPTSSSDTCDTPQIIGNTATCTLTIDSDSAANFTAGATAKVTMGGIQVTRSTDGTGANSGPATKTYVTAAIGLSPLTADDPVGDMHVLTATVTVDHGNGDGPVPAPDGTVVDLALVSGPGHLLQPSCTTGGGTGTCTDTLTSDVAGTSVVNASVDITVNGVALHRSTGDSIGTDSANAVKNWHKVQPAISTTQSPGGTVGTVVFDTAFVTGGNNPSGTVTFNLYGPTDTGCNAAPVFTSADNPLQAGKAASASFTPTTPGTYQWVATYNGDDGNLTAVSGCGDEPVSIAAAAVLGITTPNTGAGIGAPLVEGGALVLTGLGLLGLSRRRRDED